MDLTGIGYETVGSVDVTQDRDTLQAVVNSIMNLKIP
jgi:hypothetical protein